jgi:ADP-dependent NAD(P)H-hydrate dehydratase / NAD(P)H-hydrate epimerase
MSWTIVGTVPYEGFPLMDEACTVSSGKLKLGKYEVPILRGTPALLASACRTAEVLGIAPPRALLAGDTGKGSGSELVYRHLAERAGLESVRMMVFHYLQPDVDWHNRILCRIQDLETKPLLIADAGYMYVAKMSGFAAYYDLFTPDAGEIAFLADESAPHPFYTRGFLLQDEARVPDLIRRAYEAENAAEHLLVKGHCDYVVFKGEIKAIVCEPCVENMEPIGGTGDSLTGIVAALLTSGVPLVDAAEFGARINRFLGLLAAPTPAFSIADLLPFLPNAIERVMTSRSF